MPFVYCAIAVASLLVVFFIIAIIVYEKSFGQRFKTSEYVKFDVSDFKGLRAEKHIFLSNKKQKLVGYVYTKSVPSKNAVVVFAHGIGGGGHNHYMDIADWFASCGYYVFAYDVTGNDESEGKSVKGLPQALIDLDYALNYIKQEKTLKDSPVMLFGHSWGGYAISSILNIRNDIKAVVSVCGFNSTTGIIKEQGGRVVGKLMYLIAPFLPLYERIKFGKYAKYSSIKGYEKSTAKIMIIHSADDSVISIKNSYDVYYEKFKNNSRFKFVKFEDKGHNHVYYSDESLVHVNSVRAKLKEKTKETKMSNLEMSDYLNKNLDKNLANRLNIGLMTDITSFYDSCLS